MEKELNTSPLNTSQHITNKQINILKAKVKEKGRPITIWRKFNKAFAISKYIQLPQDQFQKALEWIEKYNAK